MNQVELDKIDSRTFFDLKFLFLDAVGGREPLKDDFKNGRALLSIPFRLFDINDHVDSSTWFKHCGEMATAIFESNAHFEYK